MKPLALLCLLLASCAAPIGRLNPGAAIPYDIAPESEVRAFAQTSAAAGLLAATNGWKVMESHAGSMAFAAAHECAHIADMRGISYRQAIALLTPPGPINAHMQTRLDSMHKVADRGGDPWQALKDIYGSEAVYHAEILARLR